MKITYLAGSTPMSIRIALPNVATVLAELQKHYQIVEVTCA